MDSLYQAKAAIIAAFNGKMRTGKALVKLGLSERQASMLCKHGVNAVLDLNLSRNTSDFIDGYDDVYSCMSGVGGKDLKTAYDLMTGDESVHIAILKDGSGIHARALVRIMDSKVIMAQAYGAYHYVIADAMDALCVVAGYAIRHGAIASSEVCDELYNKARAAAIDIIDSDNESNELLQKDSNVTRLIQRECTTIDIFRHPLKKVAGKRYLTVRYGMFVASSYTDLYQFAADLHIGSKIVTVHNLADCVRACGSQCDGERIFRIINLLDCGRSTMTYITKKQIKLMRGYVRTSLHIDDVTNDLLRKERALINRIYVDEPNEYMQNEVA